MGNWEACWKFECDTLRCPFLSHWFQFNLLLNPFLFQFDRNGENYARKLDTKTYWKGHFHFDWRTYLFWRDIEKGESQWNSCESTSYWNHQNGGKSIENIRGQTFEFSKISEVNRIETLLMFHEVAFLFLTLTQGCQKIIWSALANWVSFPFSDHWLSSCFKFQCMYYITSCRFSLYIPSSQSSKEAFVVLLSSISQSSSSGTILTILSMSVILTQDSVVLLNCCWRDFLVNCSFILIFVKLNK